MRDAMEHVRPLRLHAFLASAGIASRRACEDLIRQGRVTVNGKLAEIGCKVLGTEDIRVDGQVVQGLPSHFRYILLNKPEGYLSSMMDPQQRPCAIDILRKGGVSERVYNVGRLDQWSCGLLLFTNDGELAARMVHPSGGFDKEYLVETDLPIPHDFAVSFTRGILVEGVRYRASRVKLIDPTHANIVLIEGKNREIRKVLAHFGLRAMKLQRIRIGPLSDPDLPSGAWRDLTSDEVASLRNWNSAASSIRDRGGARK